MKKKQGAQRDSTMAYYHPVNTFDQGYPIYLYTTPLNNQKMFLKSPIDVFAHWAIYIQGHFYELTRVPKQERKRKGPKYMMRSLPQDRWFEIKRNEKRKVQPTEYPVGRTARSWTPQVIYNIAYQVWNRSLQSKYVYDENNCQVFIRLLVDLIGDEATKAKFPAFFDKWVKKAGLTRDSAALAITAGVITMGASASLIFGIADGGATAAAGFALAAQTALKSTTALMIDRHSKEKFIRKAQAELREELRREGILPSS